MNGKFLLDTNIILDYLKGDVGIVSFFAKNPENSLSVSAITRMELLSFHGLTPNEERRIRDAMFSISDVPITEDIERLTIDFRRACRKKLPDAIIAASAVATGAALLTRDQELARTEFPGLKIVPL